MGKARADIRKSNRGRPKNKGIGRLVAVRLHEEDDAVSDWIETQGESMSIPEAIRRLLRSHPDLKRYLGDGK